MDVSECARQYAREGRLAIFVGAGVSSISPTCLPSWWAMNRSVVTALADRVAPLMGTARANTLANTITARQEENRFPPEYQAEIIAERLRESYFKVLQCLDSTTPNATHLGAALLAKLGRVSAIVTTNFDRAMEAAFTAVGGLCEVFFEPNHFRDLAAQPGRIGEPGKPVPLIKLHGSVQDPTTLIDTLSQRKRGMPPEKAACVRHLLRHAHWLFLGYSGADLSADENYLFLKPDAPQALGFTWLLRTQEKPTDALIRTCAAYEGRSEIVHGELPHWLAEFSRGLLPGPFPVTPDLSPDMIAEIRRDAAARVTSHTLSWAEEERFDRCALVFAKVLEAVGETAAAIEVVEKLYGTSPPEARASGHFGVIVDELASYYSRIGELDRAAALYEEALAVFDPAKFEVQHVGCLSNLGMVYDRRGQTVEALDTWERALRLAEKTESASARGVALHNIAMARNHLGEVEEAERLYLEELQILKAVGDEPARAYALNNLGELEVGRRKFAQAEVYLKEALGIRDRLGDDRGGAICRANLALAHLEQDENEPALRLFEQCIGIFGRFGDRLNTTLTLVNIARLKEKTGEWEAALALTDEALLDATEAHNDPIRARGLRLLGEIQQKQGRNQESGNTFAQLLELSVRIRDAKLERDARVGCAIGLKELGDFAAAIPMLREALELTNRRGLLARDWVLDHLADSLYRKGLRCQEDGNLETALGLFLEAVETSRQGKSSDNEGQTLINVAETLMTLKRYPEAVDALRQCAAAFLGADKHDKADSAALSAADVCLWLERLDEAAAIFREVVGRATDYDEWAKKMNKIGELAQKHLARGAIRQALRVYDECLNLNREAGYLPDTAAVLLNIGGIFKATGNLVHAREYFQWAVTLLESEQHPLLPTAKSLLQECENTANEH